MSSDQSDCFHMNLLSFFLGPHNEAIRASFNKTMTNFKVTPGEWVLTSTQGWPHIDSWEIGQFTAQPECQRHMIISGCLKKMRKWTELNHPKVRAATGQVGVSLFLHMSWGFPALPVGLRGTWISSLNSNPQPFVYASTLLVLEGVFFIQPFNTKFNLESWGIGSKHKEVLRTHRKKRPHVF